MCGRYCIDDDLRNLDIAEILEEIFLKFGKEQFSMQEIFPTNRAPIIYLKDKERNVTIMTWGFEGFNKKNQVIINARSETITSKPFFKDSFKYYRCIIPTTGFFEWTLNNETKKKDKYLFTNENDKTLYLAGLYKPSGNVNRYSIITTQANESMVNYHHRMPLIIRKEAIDQWLFDEIEARKMLLDNSKKVIAHKK